MTEKRKTRTWVARLATVAGLALLSIGTTAAFAATPWSASISSVSTDELTVTVGGSADSPPAKSSGNWVQITWGDGASTDLPEFETKGPWSWGPAEHTYAAEGTYEVCASLLHANPKGNDKSAADCVGVTVEETDDGGTQVGGNSNEDDDQTEVLGEQKHRSRGKLATTGGMEWTLLALGMVLLVAGGLTRRLSTALNG